MGYNSVVNFQFLVVTEQVVYFLSDIRFTDSMLRFTEVLCTAFTTTSPEGEQGECIEEGLVYHQLIRFRTGLNPRTGVIHASGLSLSCDCSFHCSKGFSDSWCFSFSPSNFPPQPLTFSKFQFDLQTAGELIN